MQLKVGKKLKLTKRSDLFGWDGKVEQYKIGRRLKNEKIGKILIFSHGRKVERFKFFIYLIE